MAIISTFFATTQNLFCLVSIKFLWLIAVNFIYNEATLMIGLHSVTSQPFLVLHYLAVSLVFIFHNTQSLIILSDTEIIHLQTFFY